MKKYLILLLTTAVLACARQNDYDQRLATWIGQPARALVNRWGQPDRQFAINADTYAMVYIKTKNQSAYHPYRRTINYQGMPGPRYGHAMYQPIYYCKTTFSVRNGVIVNYSFNGDECI